MKRSTLRLIFALCALVLLGVEILIGLFVRDSFVRPYLGDALVVILIWCVVRVVIPDRCVWLSGALFMFAVLVEVSQIFPLCDVLGIENRLIRTLMGTSFAWGGYRRVSCRMCRYAGGRSDPAGTQECAGYLSSRRFSNDTYRIQKRNN